MPSWPEGTDVCVYMYFWADGLDLYVNVGGTIKMIIFGLILYFSEVENEVLQKGGNLSRVAYVICGTAETIF